MSQILPTANDPSGPPHGKGAPRLREEQFRDLFDALDQGIVVREASGRIVMWNPSAARILGLPDDEMGLRTPRDPLWQVTYEDGTPVSDAGPGFEALNTGPAQDNRRLRVRRGDGSIVWISVSSRPLFSPGESRPYSVVHAFTDITEQREAELALRNQEELLRRVFEVLPVGIWIVDGEGNILSANDAGKAIWAGAKYVGIDQFHEYKAWWLPSGEPLAPDDWAVARLIRKGESSLNEELEIECFDGTHKVILNSAIPIRDTAGKITGGIIVNHDITEAYRARQLLETRVAERTREIEALLEVGRELAGTLALQPLLHNILNQLQRVVPYSGAAIGILEGEELVIVDYSGPGDREAIVSVRIPVASDSGYSRIVRERAPVIVGDAAAGSGEREDGEPSAFEPNGSLAGARSWLGVPLIAKARLIGVLRLDHPELNHFTEHQANQALAFANHAAVAIDNARLYGQAQQTAALEERQHLARELHDSVSQALYAVSLAVHTARSLSPDEPQALRQALDFGLTLSQAAVAEMRALIFELRPDALKTDGLVTAIQRLIDVLRTRHHLTVRAEFGGEPEIDLKIKEALYRIAQEALTNVTKHAHAGSIDIELAQEENSITLRVSDDGQGFDPGCQKPGHIGLRNMVERAQALHGECFVESGAGRGTTVRVWLPC